MKIGILGTGNMGRALGVRFAQAGHAVFFGARDLAAAKAAAVLAGGDAAHGSNDAAAVFGEALIWTMRETDPAKVLTDASALSGKIVVETNNRDYANDVHGGAWFGEAIGERLQAAAPEALVVKAFNAVAMESLDVPAADLRAAGAQIPMAGADARAKSVVAGLAADLGFEAIDLGGGPIAFRAAEALADVLRLLMIDGKRGGRAHFKLVTLPAKTLGVVGERKVSRYR